jgi:hypothetical protein
MNHSTNSKYPEKVDWKVCRYDKKWLTLHAIGVYIPLNINVDSLKDLSRRFTVEGL